MVKDFEEKKNYKNYFNSFKGKGQYAKRRLYFYITFSTDNILFSL